MKSSVVLITGGTRGLGFATASKLVSLGATVIITGTKVASAEQVANQIAKTKKSNEKYKNVLVIYDKGNQNDDKGQFCCVLS